MNLEKCSYTRIQTVLNGYDLQAPRRRTALKTDVIHCIGPGALQQAIVSEHNSSLHSQMQIYIMQTQIY